MSTAVTMSLALLEHEARPYTVLQVGAFIGNSPNDPLYGCFLRTKYGRLFACEPIREYFCKLKHTYRNYPNVKCHRVAVSDYNGQADMYTLDIDPEEHGYPYWLSQLSSLKKERMEGMWNRYEAKQPAVKFTSAWYLKHRVTERVKCVTLKSLMQTCSLLELDVLQIDAEGSEADILKQVDFPVRFINYECALLEPSVQKRILKRLGERGYQTVASDMDTFAWRRGDRIEEVFTRLKEMFT